MPWLTRKIATSQELLFLFALGWGFGIASLISAVGFSIEVGALFAGVSLAHLPYARQIGARLKPLRDFFVILFFITLGQSLQLHNLGSAVLPALILSCIVIIIKPLVVMATLGVLRYTKRTSFMTGINLSQISEFSMILVVLAYSSHLIGGHVAAVITLVAIITITASTYLMKYDEWLYGKLERRLVLFERSITSEAAHHAKTYPLVLFGYLNGGSKFVKTFRSMRQGFVVVDYDPEVIERLEHRHINYLYGDATDPELLAEINMEKARLVINTIDDHYVNLALVRYIHRRNPDTVIICYSSSHKEAAELYHTGATYVILPHFVGSEQISAFIGSHGLNKASFERYRENHLLEINRLLDIEGN